MAIVYQPQYRVHGTTPWFNYGAVAQTWNPSHKDSQIALSGGNLTGTFTAGASTNACVYGLNSATTGKFYFEIRVSFSSAARVGIGNTAAVVNNNVSLGVNTDGLGWRFDGSVNNNGSVISTWAAFVTGNTLCLAYDLTNNLIWGRVGNGLWNNSGTADPASGVGGVTIPSAVFANPVVPAAQGSGSTLPDTLVGIFSAASWSFTAPTGFISTDIAGTPISPTTATITGLAASTQYDFEVIADNGFGQAISSIISATTSAASPPPSPPPSTLITMNVGTVNSSQPAVSQYVGGIGVGPYSGMKADGTGGGNSYDVLTNTNVQNNLNSLNFKFFRIHVGNGSDLMTQYFPTSPGTSGQNWTQFDELFAAIPHMVDLPTTRLLLTGGVAPTWCDVTTSTGQSQYANMMVQIATRAVNAGCEIFWWEPYNEPDSKFTVVQQYSNLHLAVAQALKTYATSRGKTYFVGGPTIQEIPYSTWISNMVSTCVAAGVTVDFLSWHDYMTGTPHPTTTWTTYVNDALIRVGTAHTALTQAQSGSATIPNNIPMGMTEYNMNWNYSANQETWQTGYQGACWIALYIWIMLTQQSGANWHFMSLYEAVGDSSFGIIRNVNPTGAIDPQGFFLSRFRAFMQGNQVTNSVNASLANVKALSVSTGSTIGLMLVNYSDTISYNGTTINLNGFGGTSVTQWQSNSTTPNGATTTVSTSTLISPGINLPPQSVTILNA